METAVTFPPKPQFLMSPSIAFRQVQPLLLRLTPAPFRLFASASATASPTLEPEILTTSEPSSSKKSRSNGSRVSVKKVVIDAQQLKLNRLESISYPRSESDGTPAPEDSGPANADSRRVVGVDPDISGALAVLKPDNSAQVYDSPQLRVLVGKSVRKRLDVKSIIQSTTTPTPTTIEPEIITIPDPSSSKKSRSNGSHVRAKKVVIDAQQLKLNRLESLSYPRSENDGTSAPEDSGPANADSRWVIGVDSDISGALAVLKPDNSAQVYDSPQCRVLVGKSVRKRLDVKSIIQSTTTTTTTPTTIEQEIITIPEPSSSKKSRSNGSRVRVKKAVIDAQQFKLRRLESLSYPSSENDGTPAPEDSGPANADSRWVVGVDPDISGALAVLKPDNSAQVYDSPQLRVLVGKSVRKCLDVKSIIQSTTPTAIEPEIITIPEPSSSKKSRSNGSGVRVKKAVIDAQQFKLSRLESLSYPSSENDETPVPEDSGPANADSRWVVGVDPDISGALAVLKPDNSAQVYDSPQLRVLVGKSVRKRLDVKSIIQSTTTTTTPTTIEPETIPEPSSSKKSRSNGSGVRVKKAVIDGQQLKLNWLESLSYPRSENDGTPAPEDSGPANADSRWVVGVDPDISGALAVLKPDNSAQVYDSPHLRVLVGKSVRKRLDVKSMIQLLQKVDAPSGTTVYIEQSNPYPNDGKQGWWSGGFGYGLWIGILVASGYSVVPVPSSLWKRRFKLTGSLSSKDDSRELARTLFPSMSSLLKRKKDHGRAEALLIAAHGKGLKVDPYWEYLGGLL